MRHSFQMLAAVATATAVATFALEGVASAAPEDREQCGAAVDQAQQLKDEGKYRRAREQLLICARDVCPGPIKSDCGKWLSDVDRDAPTVVFGAKDNKGDLTDIKVSMDGVMIADHLDGKPVLVDTGEHTFKFEAKDGSAKEEKVLVKAAEKSRQISVVFGPATPTPPPDNGGTTSGDKSEGGSIVPAIIVGGIGVVALGFFAGFGLAGKSDVDDLQKCKPYCSEDKVDSARTKLIVADISLGVGIVALGVATYMFITSRPKGDVKADVKAGHLDHTFFTDLKVDGGPVAGGAMGGFSTRF